MTKKLAEASFQTRLTTDLRNAGWKVDKLQSGMGYTILDLFVGSWEWGNAWIELKTINTPKVKIPLTELQRKEMRDHLAVGTVAVCLTAIKNGRDEDLYITYDPKETHVTEPIFTRKHGKQWSASIIGHAISVARARLHLRQGE